MFYELLLLVAIFFRRRLGISADRSATAAAHKPAAIPGLSINYKRRLLCVLLDARRPDVANENLAHPPGRSQRRHGDREIGDQALSSRRS
jgi:hypothetical protein